MTLNEWLKNAKNRLSKNSIPTAQLDCEVLLCDLLEKDRSWIHGHLEQTLTSKQLELLDKQIERRENHEPLAYIRGKQEFYGREFEVSADTLTPRPETETMVEVLVEHIDILKLTDKLTLELIDVGTGSGCIIITAALELSSILNSQYSTSYLGLDISKPALKIARKNAKNLGATVDFKQFDLLSQPLTTRLSSSTIILANLPYVPTSFHINLAASHEPKFAIYGGEDGLNYYRKLFEQCTGVEVVITESLPPQHIDLAKIASSNGFKLSNTKDFIQMFEKVT